MCREYGWQFMEYVWNKHNPITPYLPVSCVSAKQVYNFSNDLFGLKFAHAWWPFNKLSVLRKDETTPLEEVWLPNIYIYFLIRQKVGFRLVQWQWPGSAGFEREVSPQDSEKDQLWAKGCPNNGGHVLVQGSIAAGLWTSRMSKLEENPIFHFI